MEVIDLALPKNVENLQLPDPWLTNYWKLAENRVFFLDTEISEETLDIMRNIMAINIQDKKDNIPIEDRIPIKIYIDSPGGQLDESMAICSTIIMSQTPVITVNVGTAYSGGGLIFMAGHERYAFPYSKALIHQGSGCVGGTFEQTEQAQKIYKKQVDEMSEYILSRTNISASLMKKNKSKDWYLDAKEQLNLGLATKIVTSLDEII